MPNAIRKFLLPWTAADCFDSEALFQAWLRQHCKRFADVRAILLVLAAICLMAGYFLNRRPMMLLTILPLALVLLLSMAIGRIETILDGQADSKANEKE